jgi:hypothetical protein
LPHVPAGILFELGLAIRGAEIIHLARVPDFTGRIRFVDDGAADRIARADATCVRIILETVCFFHRANLLSFCARERDGRYLHMFEVTHYDDA